MENLFKLEFPHVSLVVYRAVFRSLFSVELDGTFAGVDLEDL